MKRFTFGLESVLHLREFYQRQAETELARAIAESERIKLLLEQNAQNRRNAALERTGADLEELLAIENYIQRLDISTEELLTQAAQAELVLEEKRRILAEKMKDAKVLSNLKDRRRFEHRREAQQTEADILDDIVNSAE